MFEGITKGLQGALSFFNRGKLTEHNMQDGLRAVQQALLEADVSYQVARTFVQKIEEEAAGTKILESLNPEQQIVGIVHQQLVNLMGPVDHSLNIRRGEITIIMMCGLQGSGKTTTCGKLATMLKAEGRRCMLVAADLQRPGAVDQLKILGQQIGLPVYSEPQPTTALKVCTNALAAAKKSQDVSVLILDTAGRLHVDAELMKELEEIDRRLQPHQVLLVCDSMTGQDAVNSAKAFNDALELNGVILTKLDGDARGGAALSIRSVTGVPIKFIGVGEQLEKLEKFHPERMAGRILGMGDVVSLFEKAQEQFDAEQMEAQRQKMLKGKFTLVDFKEQMKGIRKMGSIGDIMKMIPGMGGMMPAGGGLDGAEDEMRKIEGIIDSMTPRERENPDLIDNSRRRRIAKGSACEPQDVNKLLKQFKDMAGLMQQMAGKSKMEQFRMFQQMGQSGMLNPDAQLQAAKMRSKRGPEDFRAEAEKKKKQRKDAKKQRKKNRK